MHTARIYMDNAAATALAPQVRDAMEPYAGETYANPDALHTEGVAARAAIAEARSAVARVVGVRAEQVIFTSGGTESNNLAIVGTIRSRIEKGTEASALHVLTTPVEHRSVLASVVALEQMGVHVEYLPIQADGSVSTEALASAVRPTTALVSIILAHNEIGTIQDMRALSHEVRRAEKRFGTNIVLHTDACQAPAWMPLSLQGLGVDLLSLDAQKVHGPKGVGCLVRGSDTLLAPLLYGGSQEGGLRPGTPPVAQIVGLATALALADEERARYLPVVTQYRDAMCRSIVERVPTTQVNGALGTRRLPNNLNVSFPGLDGEEIVLGLDARGVAASTRSACLREAAPGSYVVRACTHDGARAASAVRLSLSRYTTEEECAHAVDMLVDVVQYLYTQETAHTRHAVR